MIDAVIDHREFFKLIRRDLGQDGHGRVGEGVHVIAEGAAGCAIAAALSGRAGHGKIDVITDVGGPNSHWWFNNQP